MEDITAGYHWQSEREREREMCSQFVPDWAVPCMPCLEDDQDKEKRIMNKKINDQIRKEKILHRKQVSPNIKRLKDLTNQSP